MTKSNTNTEVEYGIEIKNPEKVKKYLASTCGSPVVIKIVQKIYKKFGSDFFFRIGTYTTQKGNVYKLVLKEDLLQKGIRDKLKISKEIDLAIKEDQIPKIEDMLKVLGFGLNNKYSKTQLLFKKYDLMITIDEYPTKYYLEIEGPSKEKILDFVKNIPS